MASQPTDEERIPLFLQLKAAGLILKTALTNPTTPHHLNIDPKTNQVSLTPIPKRAA